MLFVLANLLFAGHAIAAGIDISVSHSFDTLPVSIWDSDIGIHKSIRPHILLKTRIQHLSLSQPALQGVRPLSADLLASSAGFSWAGIAGLIGVDLMAGLDYVVDGDLTPRADLGITLGIPILPNAYLNTIQLKQNAWYTHKSSFVSQVKNRIASSGFSTDLSMAVGSFGTFAANYRQEYLIPRDSLLDTSLFLARPRPIDPMIDPMQEIETNIIRTFYTYLHFRLRPWVGLGYAYSWGTSLNNRQMLTGERDTIPSLHQPAQPGPGQAFPFPATVKKIEYYSQYPYQTPVNQHSHMAVLSFPIPLSENLRIDPKCSFPLYSQRDEVSYYRDTLELNMNYLNFRGVYTVKNAAPLTAEATLTYLLSGTANFSLMYAYFSFPYLPWGHFSKDKYYIHTIKSQFRYQF